VSGANTPDLISNASATKSFGENISLLMIVLYLHLPRKTSDLTNLGYVLSALMIFTYNTNIEKSNSMALVGNASR
jgi:hypothetical protein